MAENKRYVVTGHMAVFDTATDSGRMRVTFYRGAQVPADVKPEQIEHNLSVGLIAEVPGSEPAGIDTAGAVVVGDERLGGGKPGEEFAGANTPQSQSDEDKAATAKAKADADLAEKRAEAQAKLPEDGSAPDGRASREVRIEWLAKQGHDYDELVKTDDAALKDLVKQRTAKS